MKYEIYNDHEHGAYSNMIFVPIFGVHIVKQEKHLDLKTHKENSIEIIEMK